MSLTRTLKALMLLCTVPLCSVRAEDPSSVLSWPRSSAEKFGCYLEKSLGYKDPKFNCSLKNYVSIGSPCVDGYYDGPKFPEALVHKLHPKANSVELEWEAGDLQSVSIYFDEGMPEDQIRKDFKIPADDKLPENVHEVRVSDGGLTLTGYVHMGAGDVDCPEE